MTSMNPATNPATNPDTNPDTNPAAVTWGRTVVDGGWQGHGGRLYEPRPRTITDVLLGVARWADRTFLVQNDERISFGHLAGALPVATEVLRDRGVGPGDRVMLLAYNSPAWVLSLWATWLLGAVPVLGNRWWSDGELGDAIELTEPTLVISDRTVPAGLTARGTSWLTPTAVAEAFSAPPRDLVIDRIEHDDGDEHTEDRPALVLFTSGSSGRPKAVVLPHRSLIANQHNVLLRAGRLPDDLPTNGAQSVGLAAVPLFHIGGVSSVVTNVITGGRLVFLSGRFDPGEVLRLIAREGVTSWGAVPTMVRRVLDHPDFERVDLSSLRSFSMGGAVVPDELLERVRVALPGVTRSLTNTWGLSESGGYLTVATGRELEDRPGTVGRPYPVVELRIVDPDPGGSGEVLVRSPTVMSGYLHGDDGTVDGDGWLHTGDLGRLDDEGYLYITGRSKDVVIRGGENIACPHVEAVLQGFPGVLEVAVFGLPHPDLGEELVATVVVRPGARVDLSALAKFAAGSLAYFSIPTRWHLQDDPLPTLATGKVDKRALARMFELGGPERP